jgi:general secretion pathway protein G
MRRRTFDNRIFFPWERRGGFKRWLELGRTRALLLGMGVVSFVVVVGVREQRAAGTRQTRATLVDLRNAVDDYQSKHDGGCPPSLAAVAEHRQLKEVPEDAWGRPFRLICPGRHDDMAYELMSDGPDGEPGGLDRIE